MENCIYKFLDINKNVIYVGKAKKLKARLSCHKHLPIECYKSISYVQYIRLKDYDLSDFIECYFIQKYKPIYNKTFNKGDKIFYIEELDRRNWRYYHEYSKHICIEDLKSIKEEEKAVEEYWRKIVDKASESYNIDGLFF